MLSEKELKYVLNGYFECAIWTEEENLDTDIAFNIHDFSHTTVSNTKKDIIEFISDAGIEAIETAIEENGLIRLGQDLLLTRNRHGSGFFDRGYKSEIEQKLEDAAQKLGQVNLVIGDDEKLHLE